MKASCYNIFIEKGSFSYCYNTFSKTFFRVSAKLGKKLFAFLNNMDDKTLSVPDFIIEKFKSGGFIIDDDVNEIELIRKLHREAVEDKNYFLIIMPTLDCNFHCWYCIQDHINSRMSEDTLESIKKHIDYMVNEEKISSLHIEWFGGEPLMNFNDVIVPISQYAQNVCDSVGIPFFNSATTNGYYLDKETADICGKINFQYFQITIDGNRQFHDKVKFQKGCMSSFDHILNNIDVLLNNVEGVFVILRINYTHKNLTRDIVQEVNEHISHANRGRVRIIFRKVWQENIDKDFNATLSLILDDFHDAGYSVELGNTITNFIPCYANKKYYNAITYQGNVVKCTACDDMYDENPKGKLKPDGIIEWRSDFKQKYELPTFENGKCLSCIWLPSCMGLCPRDHINGMTHCKQDVCDTSFRDAIINLMDRNYEKEIEYRVMRIKKFRSLITLIGFILLAIHSPLSLAAEERNDTTAVDLKEVVVESEMQDASVEKVVYRPSTRIKNASQDATDMLQRMAIPQLSVDPVTKVVTTVWGGSVSIFINYLPAGEENLMGLKTTDVRSVEYLDYPTDVRFRGAAHVVNIIVREYEYGGYTKLSDRQFVFTDFSNSASVFSKFSYGKMTYDFYSAADNVSTSHVGDTETSMFRLKEGEITRDKIFGGSDFKYLMLPLTFRAVYASKKVQIANTVGYKFNNRYKNVQEGALWFNDSRSEDFSYRTDAPHKDHSFVWRGDYYFLLPNEWSLLAYPILAYTHNTTRSVYSTTIPEAPPDSKQYS